MATVNGLSGGALYSGLQWDEQGRPYHTLLQSEPRYAGGRQAGSRVYVNPSEITDRTRAGIADDPKIAQWAQGAYVSPTKKNGMWKQRPKWNPRTGQYDEDFNWDNLGILGAASIIGAPFLLGSGSGGLGPGISALWGGGGAAAAPTGGTGVGTQLGVTGGSPIGSSLFGGTVAPVATTGAATTTPAAMSGLSPVAANLFGPPASSPFVRTAVNTLANTGGGGGGNPFSGMGLLDIAKLGQQAIGQYLAYHASQGASEAQLSAAREALEFAKRAYDEQNKKEQERFEATEARRAPFREGALKAHMELRRILDLDR